MKNPALISKIKSLEALEELPRTQLPVLQEVTERRIIAHPAESASAKTENPNNPRRKLIGGIVIPDAVGGNVHWRYCRNRIADTDDLTGWEFLDAAAIK